MKDPMTSSAIDHNNSQLNILSANARKRILFSTELLNSFVNQRSYDFLIVSEYHDDAATAIKNDHWCMTKRCAKGQGDLNARHQHWGDHVNKTVSKKLYEKIIEYDLEIPNEFGVPLYGT
ncbi:unnamed protein product [Didymodactylos carnosus]|uniref:Uncharacterized protein n=1 Tax=Didymodactylos carnosus TaxID=1234261 RepID=A0A8S2HR67_9BILA|nr:unnamed protein product [Didymodactylos carnosus]CAF3677755.1 unnamed protein product [Didymodactylos carnosus]